jgi:phosphatidylserine/phosphatidylglycerophosphate/cardiolipin synthase-like enzyme
MRVSGSNKKLTVQAISGTYVVVLGMDLPKDACGKLRGFSIHRFDHEANKGRILEGFKHFPLPDEPPAGSRFPSNKHPFQDFQWADYTATPGKKYTYTVTALKGEPNSLKKFAKVTLEVITECPTLEKDGKSTKETHEVYFNRGVAASQEYTRQFGDLSPQKVPDNKAFEWLSRGIYEALMKFVNDCKPGKHSLRIAAYEFHYKPFLKLLSEAHDRGVNIQIVYDARSANGPKVKNREAVETAGLSPICTERRQGASYISHNKFIVKLEGKTPVSVWTGGMNFSEGGIFGHSNVAHVVNDKEVAKKFFQYWTMLKGDPTMADTKTRVEKLTPLPATPLAKGITCVFSPRTNLDVLNRYRDLAMEGKDGICMTFAFGINKLFKEVYKTSPSTLRFALLEKKTRAYPKDKKADQKKDEQEVQLLRNMPENIFSIGSFIKDNKLDGWLKERLSGLNKNVNYVHNKFMLVDPLGKDPIVLAGSANFSDASTKNNDENMLLIRGDKRVADIYLGEFMRLWKHHSFRESRTFKKNLDTNSNLLDTGNWWEKYFEDTDNAARRIYFSKAH